MVIMSGQTKTILFTDCKKETKRYQLFFASHYNTVKEIPGSQVSCRNLPAQVRVVSTWLQHQREPGSYESSWQSWWDL